MTQEAGTPPGFWERVEQIAERAVAKYARSGALRNARISGGNGITVGDGGKFRVEYPAEQGSGPMLYVGNIVGIETGAYQGTGLLLQAPDGTDMMVVRSDAEFGTTMHNIYDSGGRIIFGNDAASGMGLARPYIGGTLHRKRFTNWDVETTSTTFETLYHTRMRKQHPKLAAGVMASTTVTGATGEVRVMVNGLQLGAVSPVAFVAGFHEFGPEPVSGDHLGTLDVEVQARVTAGAAAVRVEPWYGPIGWQT